MSRHKFRAWDKVTQKMFAVGFHLIGEVMAFGVIEGYLAENPAGKTILERMGDVEVMQWTGLQDKIGKDIYEGDIVKMTMNCFDADKPEGDEEYKKEFVSSIVWRGHGFWVGAEDFGWEGENLWDWNLIEVIGNIYENPELLKV